MGFIRYDSRVDECCCLGLRSARKALNSGSVFAGGAEMEALAHTGGNGTVTGVLTTQHELSPPAAAAISEV